MKPKEAKALQSLQIFLEDYDVTDIDVEPKGQGMGYTITARRMNNRPAFQSWGKDVEEAVTNMVRSILK